MSLPVQQIVVMKFGGTSVEDAAAMERVVSIVGTTHDPVTTKVVVVSSACAGVTNRLVEVADLCRDGEQGEARIVVEELAERHREILRELPDTSDSSTSSASLLEQELERLERLIAGTELLGETTPRTVDALLASGELLSTILLTEAMRRAGLKVVRERSDRIVATDDSHGSGIPDLDRTAKQGAEHLLPHFSDADVVVLQGFIGGTPDGVTTTLGRGGSDYSAALIGAAIGAERIEIWTDVDGILTADPRLVPSAKPVPLVTFSEARELSRFGAKVIHPETVTPAVDAGIPVVIRNSWNAELEGTTIVPDDSPVTPGFHSIAGLSGLVLLQIDELDPDQLHPLELLRRSGIAVLASLTSPGGASILIDGEYWVEPLRTRISSQVACTVTEGISLLCLGGDEIRTTPSLLQEPLGALNGTPILFLQAGSSNHTLLVGLFEAELKDAITKVHRQLFE